jgi:hypothetical protein
LKQEIDMSKVDKLRMGRESKEYRNEKYEDNRSDKKDMIFNEDKKNFKLYGKESSCYDRHNNSESRQNKETNFYLNEKPKFQGNPLFSKAMKVVTSSFNKEKDKNTNKAYLPVRPEYNRQGR